MNILKEVRRELKANVEEKYKIGNQRYFKEKIFCYGVRTPVVRKIAGRYFKQIKRLDKKQIFTLCERLLKNKYNEEATVAIQWASKLLKQFEKDDFKLFEGWMEVYIDNWAKDDDFCLHVIHPIMDKYPELVGKVKLWSHSENMWLRRASAVSFITTVGNFYAIKHNLKDIFEIAETLLRDEEDLVQKGYGWMLKAASVHNPKQVFDFVMKHKAVMPRTALRYSIEKMPASLRKQAMRQKTN
ncbi:MAG: DNA alkylation repair protein [bacterium]|nr:DNA alkylation repair protein [bacterium]